MSERKIDLSGLPRKGKLIDWKSSVGCKCEFVYDDVKGEVQIIGYEKEKTTLNIRFGTKEYKLTTGVFTKCQLGKMLDKFTSDFKVEIGETFKDEKRDITIIDREYRKNKKGKTLKYYKYKCNKCTNEDWLTEYSLTRKNRESGCNVCINQHKKIIIGVNDMATTNPEIVKYLLNTEDKYIYSKGSNKKIEIICHKCGHIDEISVSNLCNQGFSCKVCGDNISYPNKFMYNMLIQLNEDFQTEYSPKWIGRKRFDFYIPSKNLIIEMDGRLGHGNKQVIGTLPPKKSKEIDEFKDTQAIINGLEVIRINCTYDKLDSRFEFIKNNVINSRLSKIYDLDKLNWKYIDEESCKSSLINVCKFKNDNPDVMSGELCDLFNVSRSTLIKYLEIGNKLGLCDYDKKEYYKKISKRVEVFKHGVSLGIYESTMYLQRNSTELFGIMLGNSGISSVCLGKKSNYKGFTFRYV